MKTTAPLNEFGQTEAETAWVAKRTAEHHANGATMREAIGMALRDLVAVYTEMAQQKTARSKSLMTLIVRRTYLEIKAGRVIEEVTR